MIYENLVSSLGQDERFSIDQPPSGVEEHKIFVRSGAFYAEKTVPSGAFDCPRYPDRVMDEVWILLKDVRALRVANEAEAERPPWYKRTWNFLTGK
ncbi:MAG TPA: hypothetical protein VIH42_04915 [Thermoguttaceae bacterium]